MAAAAGVEMTETRLLETEKGRPISPPVALIAMATSACMRTRPRACSTPGPPNSALDYEFPGRVDHAHLTRDVREVEKMFRLAAFNVIAHNRDDHAKNFTFLMKAKGRMAPPAGL